MFKCAAVPPLAARYALEPIVSCMVSAQRRYYLAIGYGWSAISTKHMVEVVRYRCSGCGTLKTIDTIINSFKGSTFNCLWGCLLSRIIFTIYACIVWDVCLYYGWLPILVWKRSLKDNFYWLLCPNKCPWKQLTVVCIYIKIRALHVIAK